MNQQQRFQQVAALFLEAARLPSEAVDEFLDARSGADVDLKNQVRLLLDQAEKESVLGSLAKEFESLQARVRQEIVDTHTTYQVPAGGEGTSGMVREQAGDLIGRYQLIEMIGEGGFGRVWKAQQQEPVQRTVALKVIKIGMDTPQVVARFDQERQALAVMDHPGIARVFDAGTTSTGRPFFVMELCSGQPIATFCDSQRLNIRERLELVAQVCTAVHHAHTKGIIHRDIKPSNVLVVSQDGRPVAKVIDFGIAKAVESFHPDRTLVTEHRQLIGTPEYMSPEQAGGELDIDTRTDIYSLGVLLYELITGSTPFSSRELRAAGQGEVQRIIRDVDPPKPSTRLSQSTATLSSIAESRQLAPMRLASVVRGELDWVIMRAMEKERARRYESASAFAADIQRYLDGHAVIAAPPSRVYRVHKFVRRHKGAVSAASAVGLALLAGAVAFGWQARVAGEQRDRAVAAEMEANQRAEELQRVSDFQSSMLAQVDAAAAGLRLTSDVRSQLERSMTKAGVNEAERVAEASAFAIHWARVNATDAAKDLINSMILKPALATIDTQFSAQPLLETKLRSAIGERYQELGLYDEAWNVSERVVTRLRAAAGEDHPETIAAVIRQCKLLVLRAKPSEAIAILVPFVERLRAQVAPEDVLLLAAVNQLGEALSLQGKPGEAESLYRESLAGRRKVLGDDHAETCASLSNVAHALRSQGKLGEAEVFEREVMDRRLRVLGDDHPVTLSSLNNFATLLLEQGKLAEGTAIFKTTLERRRRVLGELHPDTLQTVNNFAAALARGGENTEAEAMLREASEKSRQVLGGDHPDYLNSMSNLAAFLIEIGKLAEAESICRDVLERRERVLGSQHPQTLVSLNVNAFLMQRQQRPADALLYVQQALDVSEAVLGLDHPDRIILLINHGTLSRELGNITASEVSLKEELERSERTLGLEHPYAHAALLNLSDALRLQKNYHEEVALLNRCEAAVRRSPIAPDARTLRLFLLKSGSAHGATGQFLQGEILLLEAYELHEKYKGATHPSTLDCMRTILDYFTAWHAADNHSGADTKAAYWKERLEAAKVVPPAGRP